MTLNYARETAVRTRLLNNFRNGQLAINVSGIQDAGFHTSNHVSSNSLRTDFDRLITLRDQAIQSARPEAFREMIAQMNSLSRHADLTGSLRAKPMIKDLLRLLDNVAEENHAFTRSFLPLVSRVTELESADALKAIKLVKWLLRRGNDELRREAGIQLAGIVAPLYSKYTNTPDAEIQPAAHTHGGEVGAAPGTSGNSVQQNPGDKAKDKPSSLAAKVLVEHIKSYKGAVPQELRTACNPAIEAQQGYYGSKAVPKEKDIAAAFNSMPSLLDRGRGLLQRQRRWA